MWVTGELLGPADTLESGAVVLVLDVPAEELPWLALNRDGEWIGDQLRLGKRPMYWRYRPLTWPVWNHEHRRLVRFWSAARGLDTTTIEALRSVQLDRLAVVEPSVDELIEQLRRGSRRLAGTSGVCSTPPRIATGDRAATTATTNGRKRTTCGGPRPP